MRGWLPLIWILAAALVPASAQEHFPGLAQDGTGRVWSIPPGVPQSLSRLKGADWQTEQFTEVGKLVAKSLTALSDGSVACLWGMAWNNPGGSALSRHRGDRPAVVTTGLPNLKEPRLVELSDGTLVITESGPSLVLVPKKGDMRVLTIADDLFHHTQKEYNDQRQYQPIYAVEDGAQRLWLWSNAGAGLGKRQLGTFIRLEGGKLARHVISEVKPDADISEMVRVDAGHLWFAQGGAGIYSLDIETGAVKLLSRTVPKGNDQGLAWVEQIFKEGDDWFAVVYPKPTTNEYVEVKSGISNVFATVSRRSYDTSQPCGRLLRYKEGEWDVLLTGLDARPRFGWRERPHATSAEGLLLGSHETGPWLASRPGGAPALQHSWETNFPLKDAVKFTPLGEGKMRALASTDEVAVAPIEPVPSNPRGLQRFTSALGAVEDSKGNLWCMRDKETLVKWDGESWKEQAPPKLNSRNDTQWWGDDRDQGWYFGDNDKAAICDFATGTWKKYPGRDAALVAQLPHGTHLNYVGQQYWLPVYSGTGQIAWLSGFDGLHFYDGTKWRKWTMREIASEPQQLEGAPFFNSEHQLCMPMGPSNYTWDAADGAWQAVPRSATEGDRAVNTERTVIVPEDCPLPKPASGANDSLGTAWITSPTGELFRAVPGRTVQVLTKEEPNPFRFGRRVRQALLDARGGVMLLISGWQEERVEYLYIPAKAPLPMLTAKMQAVGGDTARVLLTTEPAGETWFSWQVDDGPWQPVQQEKTVTLTKLASGKHRLAMRAYNTELGADRTPALLEFAIEADAVETMKSSIAGLSAPTRERREAAAKELRALGIGALPALKEALKNGRADGQWWLNKVIEQIEEDLAAEPKKKE